MRGRRIADLMRRSRVPWGLVGMVAMVALVEGSIWRHAAELSDYQSYSWRTSADAASGPAARADVLCLGDSQVKLGVVPRILEARLGGRAYNLAVLGGQAPSTFFLLRRALRAGARPRAVVVDHFPNLLAFPPKVNRPRWADLVDPRDLLDLGWNSADLALALATAASYALPSTKDRLGIRESVRAALDGERRRELPERDAFRRNWDLNRGAHLVAADPHARVGEAEALAGHGPRHWKPHRANVTYLRRFLDLAARQNVAVFWVLPPTVSTWQSRREELGLDQTYARFVRELTVGYPNVVVVDGRHAEYPPTAFADPIHLNRVGAAEFSDALAEVMAGRLGAGRPGGRWATLGAFRGRKVGVPLEDVQQSRMALGGAGAARR